MNFIIILIGFDIDIDIFTQLNTTVSRQSLLLVLLFSNTISAIRPEDPPRKEKWILGTARRQRQPKDSSCWIEGSSRGKRWHNDHPHWHWTHCVCCRLVHILNWLTIYHEYLLCSCCCCCCCLKSESHLIVVVVDVVVVVIVVVVLIAIVWNEADQVVASDHHWEEAKSIESAPCMDPWLLIIILQLGDSLIITIYIPAWRVDYNYITVWLKITTVIIFCTFLSSSCIHASWVNDATDFDFPSFFNIKKIRIVRFVFWQYQ